MQIKLTQAYIQNIKTEERRMKIRDTLLKGLVLFVDPSGRKTWYVDYKRPNGKRTDHKIGNMELFTVAEAREAAREFLASVALGEDPVQKRASRPLILRELIDDFYMPSMKTARKSGSYQHSMLFRNFVFLMDMPLEENSILKIERWRAQRKADGVTNATMNRPVTVLKAVLNWAVKRDLLNESPLRRLELLKETDSQTKVRYLSADERERFLKALDDREERIRQERDNHNKWLAEREREELPSLREQPFADHLKPMILISLNTGIRRGALFALEWGDVDFLNRVLTLRAESAKSGKLNHVPLNETAFRTLQAWRTQTKGSGLVFPSPVTGDRIDNCHSAWENLLKEAGIENFRWHDMRHDFASQLVMKGVDLNTVRELLGHADLKMTLRYAHLAPQIRQAAVELLE